MTAAGANGNDRPAPETALAVLASEHRLSILQAFYEAYEPGTIEVDRSLSFTEIYERTDTTSTAQLSYHVEKLVGRYLTETADGYALTYAGVKLRQALRTGTYTDVPDREAIPIEEDCPVCNTAALEARCVENYVEIYCTDHGDAIGLLPFPPSRSGHGNGEFLRALNRYHRYQFGLAIDGICPECGGEIEPVFELHDDPDRQHDAWLRLSCETCGWWRGMPSLFAVLEHPVVVGFYADHGENVRDRPFWYLGANWDEEILSEDPLRVAISTRLDGDELRVAVDDDLDVFDIRRQRENDRALTDS